MSAQFDPNANAMFLKVVQQAYASIPSAGGGSASKYSRWFNLEGPGAPPENDVERTLQKRIAEGMKAELAKVGEENYAAFAAKMSKVQGHKMVRSVAAGLIPGTLTHGSARFGQVVEKHKDRFEVTRFFVANGDIELDTSKDNYISLADRNKVTKTYYGLAQIVDRDGNLIGFNKDVGDNGVAFMTSDPTEALCQIAAASTGKDVDDFRRLILPKTPGIVNAAGVPVQSGMRR